MSDPILPVQRLTTRPQRVFAIGVMRMVVSYSSLPDTRASTVPLPMTRSTTDPLRTYVRPRGSRLAKSA